MSRRPLALAAVAGIVGGGLAVLLSLGAALLRPLADGRFASYAAVLVTLISVQLGARAAAEAPGGGGFGARLGAGATIAAIVAAAEAVGLYVLYAGLRPGLLAARYAAVEAAVAKASLTAAAAARAAAALAARRAQALDPLYQALEGAGLLLFCGLVLAAYLAFRARVVERLTAGRPSPRR
ncbi:MAG: hypothetical protein JSR73_00560 [Proteobacteria bacterium]|nr:hypothetical protein [Pseudomonadota bacterium]